MLRVAGAWHSEHMRSAVAPFFARIESAFGPLRARMFSACTGGEVDSTALPSALADGLVRPVRFVDVLHALENAGVRRAIVAAPSRTVRSLIRRTLGTRVALVGADDPAAVDRIGRGD
jgi:malonyl CoA-acyl carrier protein transacylase